MRRRLPTRLAARTLGVVVGVAFLALALHGVDRRAIAAELRQVGAGFVAVVAIAGLRQALRAAAWRSCLPGNERPTLGVTAIAVSVGEALGNLTPFGLAASEPAKVLWLGRYASRMGAAVALLVETFIYSSLVLVSILAGTVVLLAVGPLPAKLRAVLAVTVLAGAAGAVFVGAFFARRVYHRKRDPPLSIAGAISRHARSVREVWLRTREEVMTFASRRPGTLAFVIALELLFHVAAVGEVYVTLLLLRVPGSTLGQALALEYVNRVVTVAFKFVPLRLGIDELASGSATNLLGAGPALGVSVAVIRQARILALSGFAVALVGWNAWIRRAGLPFSRQVAAERPL